MGEYSAGLYGHSHPIVIEAIVDALREGVSRSAYTGYEVEVAEVVCERFGSIEARAVHQLRHPEPGAHR